MRYRVYGTHSGNEFQAPVDAVDASDAVDEFLESVEDPTEFSDVEAEVWG